MNLYAYVGGNPVNWIDPLGLWGLNDIKKIIDDPRVKAITSFAAGIIPQLIACNIDPGFLRSYLFGISSLFDFYGAAQATVVSATTGVIGGFDPDPGVSRIGLLLTSGIFYKLAENGFEGGLTLIEAAIDDFNTPSDCIDPCKRMRELVDSIKHLFQ